MIANVSAHRRANAFAQALEEESERGTAAEQSEEPAPAPPEPAAAEPTEQGRMLSLAAGLGALPKPELDPEVKVVQRAQLVAAMEAMLQEGEAADPSLPGQRSSRARGAHRATPLKKFRPRTRLAKGLTAGGLSVGVAASAFGGVAAASSDALPGDSLYGLKRGIEDFKLGLAGDDAERGRAHLDQASTRLNETRRLLDRGRGGPLDHETLGEIRHTLSGMRYDASEGHRLLAAVYERDPDSLGPIQALSSFSESQRRTWGVIRDKLPVQLGDVSEEVSSVFDAIDEDVEPLRPLLPQPPAHGDTDERPGTGKAPTDGADPGGGTAPGTGSGDPGSSSSPSKPADAGEHDGLLGGNTGGLLDPPKDTGASTPSTSQPPAGEPDVTVPPLLPGLLPGLGIDSEDDE
ncbi:DUF5667 domain-containing protein [Streptomyces sp. DH24]|uniref:DUF5667 domain-containing protein n=1 Tax=Streptomyces sp. DH24 TaxID=3040123 RepID=UPI002441E292|nr:DUF5667 domain-containing protein [Streptomyces sp. DH24]MDG9718854.1 DUF5667 domain-containing protein [Streptomyces sp. DH24]